MAVRMEEGQSPKGRPILVLHVSGDVSGEEAQRMLDKVKTMGGGPLRPSVLSFVEPGTKYSAESQRVFTRDFAPHCDRTAAVVSSKFLRATINFMVRVGGNAQTVRTFDTEEDAMSWLDEPR